MCLNCSPASSSFFKGALWSGILALLATYQAVMWSETQWESWIMMDRLSLINKTYEMQKECPGMYKTAWDVEGL